MYGAWNVPFAKNVCFVELPFIDGLVRGEGLVYPWKEDAEGAFLEFPMTRD